MTGRFPWLKMAALTLLAASLFCLSLGLGSISIPLPYLLSVLAGDSGSNPVWTHIVLQIRLPRSLAAVMAGAALSLSGLQMQTLFRNPLAGPYVLGISSGASLGVGLVVLAGFGTGGLLGGSAIAAAAVLGSAGVMGLVLSLSRVVKDNMTLLILGLMFGYACGAVVNVLVSFSSAERIMAFAFWNFGTFAGVTWSQMIPFAAAFAGGTFLGILSCKPLNALLLGENYARSLGLNVVRARLLVIAGTSVLTGVVTAYCGPIAFLGLAVPHLCRGVLGSSDHRVLVPGTLLMGAALALAADIAAGLPGSDRTLPLNSVTALIGAPVVIWIVLRRPRDSAG